MSSRAVTRALCIVAVAACGRSGSGGGRAAMSAAEQQQIRDLVRAADATARAHSEARERGLRDAWRVEPPHAVAACPVALPKLPRIRGGELDDHTREEREALDVARWRMNVVTSGAVLGEPPPAGEKPMEKLEREVATRGPRRDQFDRQRDMLLRIADEGRVPETFDSAAHVIALAREIGSDPYWGWELDIIASEYVHPLFDPSGFSPGRVMGKAFVWSFPERRVVCTALVVASNQDKMTLRFDPDDKRPQKHRVLEEDLRNEAYRIAISNLLRTP
jgi:hypothetical protein